MRRMVLTIEDMQAKMNTGVPYIRSTAQANLDLFRSIRRLTASESAKLVPADSGAANTRTESEMAEDLAYDAARLIRSEGSLAQRAHLVSFQAHSGLLEELA